MKKKTRNVIVAGGAGFIGFHLCKRLLGEGCHVVCVDNLSTGNISNVEILRGLISAAGGSFEFYKHDITAPLHYNGDVDQIYNLACPASPIQYQSDPVHTMITSVEGSTNLLSLAHDHHARIMLASTSEVYGNPLCHPQREDYWGNVNPNGVRSCYDEGKRAAEAMFCDWHRTKGVDTRIVRIFNTYGPNMSMEDGRVVSNMILQALKDVPITVYGDGRQTRSFMYVADLIEGLARVMADGVTSTPINLGNPCEVSISSLANRIKLLTASASPIVYKPLPQDDPVRRCPDISKATEELGDWQPQISLDEGLKKTISYFRKCLQETHKIEKC